MSLVVPLEEIFAHRTKLLANHESWERVELGNVCKILNGFPFKSTLFNKSEGFPVIRIRDITRSSTETFYSGDVPPEYVVTKGDLLIGMDGNFRCCEWQGRDAGLNQRVCKITPDERILNRKFLLFGLNGYLKAIEDVTSSVTVGHLSSRDVQRIPFPLPPLAEQRRIVVKLETLLGKVDASQQRLAKIPVLLKRFRQSVLAAACSGRLTADWREENDVSLEKSWRDAELRDICSSISDGDHLPPPKQASGIPFLTIGNISSGRLDFSTTRFVSESYFSRIKPDRIPKCGDTLYTVVGATIGIPVLVDADRPFCFQRHIAILKPSSETSPKYLHTLMGCPEVFRQAWDRVTGSAQPTLPLGNLRTIPVSVPPLPEQQEIVRRVEGLLALADQLEVRLAKARGQVDKLTPSLLARAFAGQLVPQNPTDEPAEKLLERIRASTATPG